MQIREVINSQMSVQKSVQPFLLMGEFQRIG